MYLIFKDNIYFRERKKTVVFDEDVSDNWVKIMITECSLQAESVMIGNRHGATKTMVGEYYLKLGFW